MLCASKDFNLIFVHVPKTGGNSITQSILDAGLSADKKVIVGHQDGLDRFEVCGQCTRHKHQFLTEYYSICPFTREIDVCISIRKPFERLVSLYFSPHRWLRLDLDTNEYISPAEAIFSESEFCDMVSNEPSATEFLGSAKDERNKRLSSAIENYKRLVEHSMLRRVRQEKWEEDMKVAFGINFTKTPRNIGFYSSQTAKIRESIELRKIVEESHHAIDLELFYG